MTANLYLAISVSVCVITLITSLVYNSVKSYRKLVKDIRIVEIVIIDRLKKELSGDTLDSVVDIVTTALESVLRQE